MSDEPSPRSGTVATEAPAEADTHTRTELAARPRRDRRRRWWWRRPVRRALVLTHRWTSLVLGLLLVVECTSGVVALYAGELFRAGHGAFYEHTDSATPITAQRAFELVERAHPEFGASWVSADAGVFAVGDADYGHAYPVDPGTGRIGERTALHEGVVGWLVNLHDCGFGCSSYAGYVSWAATPLGWLGGISGGEAVLVLLGLLMILLVITGIITWWPGLRRFAHGFRVRTGRGRFARDYDLHNVIGLVALPFLLMWGVTGAAFYAPAVQNTWLRITGGEPNDPDRYSFTADPAAPDAPVLGIDRAAAVATARVPGEVRYLVAPTADAAYYSVSVASAGYRPYEHRVFFSGETTVYVDAHHPEHVAAVPAATGEPAANTFYDKVFEAAHFGWLVNGWWRIVWAVLGLAPLALAVTGMSTWLYRRGVRKRRRAAA